ATSRRSIPIFPRLGTARNPVVAAAGNERFGSLCTRADSTRKQAFDAAEQTLRDVAAALVRHLVHVALARGGKQPIVARCDLVDEPELERFRAVPMLARRDRIDVDLGPVLGDLPLEELVNLDELLLELLAPLFGVLAEHRQRPLIAAGGDLLEVDALALEQPMEVRQLREHADRADDRERRGDDLVRDARHQIAAARSDLVDGDVKRNALLADARELRRREAVVVHGASGVLEP